MRVTQKRRQIRAHAARTQEMSQAMDKKVRADARRPRGDEEALINRRMAHPRFDRTRQLQAEPRFRGEEENTGGDSSERTNEPGSIAPRSLRKQRRAAT